MSLTLYLHPFALYCWKPLIALHDREVDFTPVLVEDRSALAELWAPASIPVLVDGDRVIAESSVIVEYLDRHGAAPRLIPADPDAALAARMWDRVIDGYVATPVQSIVADALRPAEAQDPHGVSQAHDTLDLAYATLERHLQGDGDGDGDRDGDGWLAGETFTLADCAAAPALHYADVVHPLDRDAHPHLAELMGRLLTRPSVARVIDEARPYRALFPLPWPEHVA